MHKVILEAPTGKVVDHINGDKLDNRRVNLRVVTQSQNSMNRRPYENTKSGYKGVTFSHGRWQARIGSNGIRKTLGYFKTAREAAEAYAIAAKDIQGECMHPTTMKVLA
jgi:hypothetical protein